MVSWHNDPKWLFFGTVLIFIGLSFVLMAVVILNLGFAALRRLDSPSKFN